MRNEKLNSDANNPLPSTRSSLDAFASCLHKQKNKALGLSVMTCFLMGPASIQAAHTHKKNQHEVQADLYIPSQAAMLTAAEKERLAKQSQTIQKLLEESKENAEMIQDLSEELQVLSYKLAHAKVDLFNFQENPEQKAKIEALRQQIQEIRYSNKKLEDLVVEKQHAISTLENALEKSKALFNEKNEEVAYLSQIYEALQMRVAAEKIQTTLFAEGLHQIDQKQIELDYAHKALNAVDQELVAQGKSLQEIQKDYQQLFDLYTLELADNQTTQKLLNEELQSLHEQHREKDILITNLLSTAEQKEIQFAQTLEEKSQQIAKLMNEMQDFEDLIISKSNAVEEYKAYELSLLDKYEEERAHAETMTKELFTSLAQVEKLQKDLEISDQLKLSLRDAEDKIISLNQALQLQENDLKNLITEHQNQIALNEELKQAAVLAETLQHSEKQVELERLTALLKDREETIRFFEQELEGLAEAHKVLQEEYQLALAEQQNAQQKFELNLQEMLAKQQDKEKATLELENDLDRLAALLQEREETLQAVEKDLHQLKLTQQTTQQEQEHILTAHEKTVQEVTTLQQDQERLTQLLKEREETIRFFEQELEQLLVTQQTSQQDRELILAAREKAAQETAALQQEQERLAALLKDREETVRLFEQDIEGLADKYQTLQSEYELALANKQQDRSIIANLQQTQQELKDELAQSLTQHTANKDETLALQNELTYTIAQLQDREQTLQIYEKELEQLLVTQQTSQQDRELILAAREKAAQETAALQQEQERLASLLKDREETIRFFEQDIEELAGKYQTLQSEYELVFANKQQDQSIIANLQQTQQELKDELTQSLAQHTAHKDETLALQNELSYTIAQLQDREQTLQIYEKELEQLLVTQQTSQQDRELILAAREKAAQETAALQQEQERLASLLKDREETIRFFEQDIEELAGKYQTLQSEYELAFATKQQDQALIANLQQTQQELKDELAQSLAQHTANKDETLTLQNELTYTIAQLQDREQTLQIYAKELEELLLTQQTSQQDQELILAAREKAAQETAALQQEQERLTALLKDREETIRFFEQDIEELADKYQTLQSDYELAFATKQQDQALITNLQHTQQELKDELTNTIAQLQNREQALQVFEKELEQLTLTQQTSQQNQELILAAHEKVAQETAALQQEQEHLTVLLKDREETIRLFEQDIEELAGKYQTLQSEYELAFTNKHQDQTLIGNLQHTQQELKDELAQSLAQHTAKKDETFALQNELAHTIAQLQDREQTLQIYAKELEQLTLKQQTSQQDQELILAAREKAVQETAALQQEQERLAVLLQDREETIRFFEQDVEELTTQYHTLQKEHLAALADRESVQKALKEELEETLAHQAEQSLEAKAENLRLAHLVKDREETISLFEEEIEELAQKHQRLETEHHLALANQMDFEEQLEKVVAQQRSKEELAAQLQDEIKRLTSLLQEKEDKLENLEQNFLALFSEKEAESLFLKQKIEKVEADFLTKESELAELMNELKGASQEKMASDNQ